MLETVTENIKLLRGGNNGKFPYSHSLVIEDESRAIIDTGVSSKSLALIAVEEIRLVINTHCHFDHIAKNPLFKQATVYMHHLDAQALKNPKMWEEHTGLDWDNVMGGFLKFWGLSTSPFEGQEVVELQDGDIIDFGKTQAATIHAPGHSAGHCCFYFQKEDVLFSGDIDLTSFGPWYGNPFSDIDQFVASIKRLVEIAPGCIITSHAGLIRENIRERLFSYLAVIQKRDDVIVKLLKEPHTLEQIVNKKPIFKKYPSADGFYQRIEREMVSKHLKRLQCQERVTVVEGGLFVLKG